MKKCILFSSKISLFFCFYLLIFPIFAQTASIPHSLDEAISLFNAGNHNQAKILLRQNLELDPNDSDSRSILGKMNYHLGEWQNAIDIWSEGLNGKPSDYIFQMNIGNVFFEKAQQNSPLIYLTSYSKEEIEEDTEKYQKDFLKNTSTSFLEYWQKGINAYQSAHKIYPYEEYILEKLGTFYQMNRKFDSAFIYHQQLAELYPKNSYYITNAAIYQAKIKTNNQKAQDSLENIVIKKLNHSLEIDAQNPDTYRELARILKKKNQKNSSLKMTKKADFYASIPKYARFKFSIENDLLLNRLLIKNNNYQEKLPKLIDSLAIAFSEKDVILQNLLVTVLAADASDSKLLHTFNNHYLLSKERKKIINALAKTHQGQWLLVSLLKETKEIELTKEITTTLVRKNSPNMHDVLIDLLEYDYLDESMDIAQSLSRLNDERSRNALIKELYLPLPKISKKRKDKIYYSIQKRQMRAALALSSFKKNVQVHEELNKGLNRQEVRLFCAVALYAQTGRSEYLKLAKKFKPRKISYPELEYFLSQFNDSRTNSLAKKLIKK